MSENNLFFIFQCKQKYFYRDIDFSRNGGEGLLRKKGKNISFKFERKSLKLISRPMLEKTLPDEKILFGVTRIKFRH